MSRGLLHHLRRSLWSYSVLFPLPSVPRVRKLLYRIDGGRGGLDLSLTFSSHRSQIRKKEQNRTGSVGHPSLNGKARSISRAMIRMSSWPVAHDGRTLAHSYTYRRTQPKVLFRASTPPTVLGFSGAHSRSAAPAYGASIPGDDGCVLRLGTASRARAGAETQSASARSFENPRWFYVTLRLIAAAIAHRSFGRWF